MEHENCTGQSRKGKHLTKAERVVIERMTRASLRRKLLLGISSPILLLLLIEGALLIGGYGKPTAFLVPWRSGHIKLQVVNADYCYQFVPKAFVRQPMKRAMSATKGANTIRIFVLGGSAAYGDPEPVYGFCRMLQVLLNESSDTHEFEVINAAITAMDSGVALRVARDCVSAGADALIVYTGNNEVIGPFRPVGVPLWLYRSRLFMNVRTAMSRSRIGQLVRSILDRQVSPEWQGMKAFLDQQITADAPELESCYRHFRENLEDIIRVARRVDASVLLCTVPVNLRSCPPFAAQHRDGLTSEELHAWNRFFDEGRQLQLAGQCDDALERYEAARKLDDRHAVLAFCMGQCAEECDMQEYADRLYGLADPIHERLR